eukprot:TRINITY_DN8567_c0_g1_i7.p1 TRINITY_DN8567_c0_g1~~TRINITY_DN8567_c0_g1_i7.p1  ORF type:complete len:1089 (-),score=258.35 TRINITY_DN8567_c0_g1_i7:321-3587(-)
MNSPRSVQLPELKNVSPQRTHGTPTPHSPRAYKPDSFVVENLQDPTDAMFLFKSGKKCLKIVVVEGKLSDKSKPKSPRGGPKIGSNGWYVTLQILDHKGYPAGSQFTFHTKVIADKFPTWNQTCLFTLPRDTMSVTHSQLQLTVYQCLGQKHKSVGQGPNIDLLSLEEDGMQEKILYLNTKPSYYIRLKLGWYGTGARAQKATEDLKFASMKIYTELDVQEIAQKILKFEKELSQLEQEMMEIQEKNNVYAGVLAKYRDIDDEARELVSGGGDTSFASNESSYLEYLQKRSPKTCAEFLSNNFELEHIPEIKTAIFDADEKWCLQFLAHDGLKNVVDTIVKVESSTYPPIKNVRVAQLASIIKSLMNKHSVAEKIINGHSHELKLIIKTFLTSKNPLVKAQMFAFFSALCLYGRISHSIVMTALLELDGGTYHSLLNVIKTERDREVITSVMMLINALLAGEKEIGARQRLRDNFNTNGLVVHTEHLREHLSNERSLIIQFNVYLMMARSDEEELKVLRYVDNMDLYSEMSIFNMMCDQVDKLEQGDTLLRHLQHLLLVPNVSNDAKKAWSLIEKSSRRATVQTEKEAQICLTITELNREVKQMHNRRQLLDRWYTNRPKPPLPPGARGVHGPLKPSILQVGGDERFDIPHDHSVPEPQRKMKPLFWVAKYKENDPEIPEYWHDVGIEITKLGTMFQDLQERFYQPKNKNIREQKISLLPLPVANSISVWRAQFPHMDDEAIIQDIFDIENSAGTIFTYHFEALLSAIPKDADLVQLKKYRGNITNLEKPDQFLMNLLKVPRLTQKLSNLIFWDEFGHQIDICDITKDQMAEACNNILDNPQLYKVLGLIMSLTGLLDPSNRVHRPSRLRSATVHNNSRGLPTNSTSTSTSISTDASEKSKELGDIQLSHHLTSFISKNFSDLKKYAQDIIQFEKAWRYQPVLLRKVISSLEEGYVALVEDLQLMPTEIDPLYEQYYDAMDHFRFYAMEQVQRVKLEFEAFENHSLLVLQRFGITKSKDALQDLWCTFYLFTKHFKIFVDCQQTNKDEDARRKRLEVRQMSSILGVEGDKEFGTIDKLIASIREGFLG